MEITVLTFGAITDIIGKNTMTIAGVASTDELKQRLNADYPRLSSLQYTMAVNKEMITSSVSLTNNETVALLPPFSGG